MTKEQSELLEEISNSDLVEEICERSFDEADEYEILQSLTIIEVPVIETLPDREKYEFFVEHFDKITLAQLEGLV